MVGWMAFCNRATDLSNAQSLDLFDQLREEPLQTIPQSTAHLIVIWWCALGSREALSFWQTYPSDFFSAFSVSSWMSVGTFQVLCQLLHTDQDDETALNVSPSTPFWFHFDEAAEQLQLLFQRWDQRPDGSVTHKVLTR